MDRFSATGPRLFDFDFDFDFDLDLDFDLDFERDRGTIWFPRVGSQR